MFLDERVDVSGIEIENVVAVRYECTQKGSGNKWPSMREFKVSTTPETGVEFTKEVIRTQDGWAPYQGEESNLIDENTQTSIWYNVRQNGNPANTTIKGDYVGVKLSQPITLGKIDILQGKNDNDGDYFKNVNLHIAPGTMYSAGVRSDELQLVWTQVTTCIKEGSWKAIYASSDEEFDKIVADMVAQANEYGYDQCVEFQENEVTLRAAAEDAARAGEVVE